MLPPFAPRPSIRRLASASTAVAVLAAGLISFVGDAAAASTNIHVSPAGRDNGSGQSNDPVLTVGRAVKIASPGDTVVLASGTYHEMVQVYAKEVHLTAAPGADVVFDGATQVNGWTPNDGAWTAPWSTEFERAGLPYTRAERPEAGWPEQFWIDGVELAEARNRSDLGPGYFYHDRAADLVWIDDNPTGRLVEGSDLSWGIYLNHAHGSSIEGVTVRRYATQRRNMAAVRAYANNLTLSDITVEDNAYMGVSMIGTGIAVDGLTARRNGHLGAHAHQSRGISIADSVIESNNAEGFDGHHSAGGFKVTESSGVRISGSRVTDNGGPGIWTDLSTVDIEVIGNWVDGNTRSGIEIELSERAVIADNTVSHNGEAGVWVLESGDVDVWHNAVFDNYRDIWVEDGPRSDVQRVAVVNNTMGGSSGAPAIVNVDDWTEDRSAEQMDVELQSNRYWLPEGSSTPNISRWANWPYPLELSPTIGQHISATSGDEHATLLRTSNNPYVRSATDSRAPAGSSAGTALTASVAAALQMGDGHVAPAGPITAFDGAAARTTPPTINTTPPTTTSASTSPSSTTVSTATTVGGAGTTTPTNDPSSSTADEGLVEWTMPVHASVGANRSLQPAERRSSVVFRSGLMGTARLLAAPSV